MNFEQNNSSLEAEELSATGQAREKENPSQAFSYFSQAAAAGNADAMACLGACYLHQSFGAAFDLEKSAYWYEQGANAGSASCMFMLAIFHMSGIGREQDDSKAQALLMRAAEIESERISCMAIRWLNGYRAAKDIAVSFMNDTLKSGGTPQK